MKPLNFFRLLLSVTAIVAVGLLGLQASYNRAHTLAAETATVESAQTSIGTPFAGSLESLEVAPGDRVEAGEEIARLQSPTLEQAMTTQDFSTEGVGFEIEDSGTMVFYATEAGTVSAVHVSDGSFTPANAVLADIAKDGSHEVVLTSWLSAREYAALQPGAPMTVSMPDGSDIELDVTSVTFHATDAGRDIAQIRAAGEPLNRFMAQQYLPAGTPVEAEVLLRDEGGFGAYLVEQVGRILTPDGVRL